TLLGLGLKQTTKTSGPITVGFEFEDATASYPSVKIENAHKHVAKVEDLDLVPESVGMIVGADVPSGATGGFADLEVRSDPFDLSGDDPILAFMQAYKALYKKLYAIDGLKVPEKVGGAVQPQVTVSVPFDRAVSFVRNAPLVWPWEESALLMLMSIKR